MMKLLFFASRVIMCVLLLRVGFFFGSETIKKKIAVAHVRSDSSSCFRLMFAAFRLILLVVISSQVALFPATASARSALHGDIRYLYYGEVVLGSVGEGLHRRLLVPVPDQDAAGNDVVPDAALHEAPEVVFNVVDGFLMSVTVRPETAAVKPRAWPQTATVKVAPSLLPPFRILISDAELEDDAERGHVILDASSRHTIADRSTRFDMVSGILLRTLDPHRTYYIRLDTYERRVTTFLTSFWLGQNAPANSKAVATAALSSRFPANTTFGVRFEYRAVTSANGSDIVEVRVFRKPPAPPVVLTLTAVHVNTTKLHAEVVRRQKADLLRGLSTASWDDARIQDMLASEDLSAVDVASKDAATHAFVTRVHHLAGNATSASWPRGFGVAAPFRAPRDARDLAILIRVAADFEELHRSHYEWFELKGATAVLQKLKSSGGEKVLMPRRWQELRSEFVNEYDQQRVRDEHFVRLSLRRVTDAVSQAIALLVLQPYPIQNLQVHVVDGYNDTFFLAEEYDVPYRHVFDVAEEPFGWHRAVRDDFKFVSGGDALEFHVFYDLRDEDAHAATLGNTASGVRDEEGDKSADDLSNPHRSSSALSAFHPEPYKRAMGTMQRQWYHHTVRHQFEATRRHTLFWKWIVRHGGYVALGIAPLVATTATAFEPLLLCDASRPTAPHDAFRSLSVSAFGEAVGDDVTCFFSTATHDLGDRRTVNVEVVNRTTAPTTDRALIRIPGELIMTTTEIKTVDYLRNIFRPDAASRYHVLLHELSIPPLNDILRPRNTAECYISPRTLEVLKLTLLTLFRQQDAPQFTSRHLWFDTLFQKEEHRHEADAALPISAPLFPLLFTNILAKTFRLHNLAYFATVVEQRSDIWNEMFDVLVEEIPWYFPKQMNRWTFKLRVSLVERFVFESVSEGAAEHALLYLVPGVHYCHHSDTPTVRMVFDQTTKDFVLRTHQRSQEAASRFCQEREAEGSNREWRKICMGLVTCDFALGLNVKSRQMGRLTTLESLLRRGEVSDAAEGVVDITVRGQSSPIAGVADRVFLITRESSSLAAAEEFVEQVICVPALVPDSLLRSWRSDRGLHSRVTNCTLSYLREQLAARQQLVPTYVTIPEHAADRAASLHVVMHRMLLRFHQVLVIQSNNLLSRLRDS